MSQIRTACPVAERTLETFVQSVNIAGERQRVEFQREVVWLLESETELQFVHGGEVVSNGACANDWYGLYSSLDPEDIGALSAATRFKVDALSSLEIQLVTTVFLNPVMETPEDKHSNLTQPANYRAHFSYIPDSWRYERLAEDVVVYPKPERKILATEVTWSTKWTDDERLSRIEDFKKRWAIPQPRVCA
ncbi:TPA: hypothetical protein ACP32N_003225 [Pseudomonas aeruginosa]